MKNLFNYTLELKGKDYSSHTGRSGEYVSFVPFKQSDHFITIREALDALVLKDIRQFEERSDEVRNNKYYETCQLHMVGKGKPLLSIVRISDPEISEKTPTAGIYMSFGDRTLRDFENFSGLSFAGYNNRDPNSSVLLLASITSELYGLAIKVDENVKGWYESLKYYELEKDFKLDDWKYKAEIVANTTHGAFSREIKNYHFHQLPEAVRFLLGIDIKRLDERLAAGLEDNHWFERVNLTERGKRPILDLIAARHPDGYDNIPDPGIHLKFSVPIEQLEADAKIDLSGLGNYGDDDKYLLLAYYKVEPGFRNNDYHHYTDILPQTGYIDLLLKINDQQPEVLEQQEQAPFLVRVEWRKSTENDTDKHNNPVIRNSPCPSLEDGLSALLNLEDRFFDQQKADEQGYPFFIKRADLIDNDKNTIVISKYQKTDGAGKGLYMSFDNLDESLRLLLMLDLSFMKRRAENKGDLSQTDTEIQRKRTSSERTVQPPGSKGPHL